MTNITFEPINIKEIIIFTIIYLIIPLLCIFAYFMLCLRMKDKAVSKPPYISFGVLFLIYAGWIIVWLTSLFWKWSGLASIGIFFLILVAPFISLFLIIYFKKLRTLSVYHATIFKTSISYYPFLLFMLFILWVFKDSPYINK